MPRFLMRNVEYLVQPRFADIQSDDDYLFTQERQTDGKVGSDECFSFTAHGGSDKDYFFIRVAQYEKQIGA